MNELNIRSSFRTLLYLGLPCTLLICFERCSCIAIIINTTLNALYAWNIFETIRMLVQAIRNFLNDSNIHGLSKRGKSCIPIIINNLNALYMPERLIERFERSFQKLNTSRTPPICQHSIYNNALLAF